MSAHAKDTVAAVLQAGIIAGKDDGRSYGSKVFELKGSNSSTF